MRSEDALPRFVEDFFRETTGSRDLRNAHLFVFRKDGVVLYHDELSEDPQAIGALMGGMWQAAQALSSFVPTKYKDINYRLSFDTSSSGIYVLPFNVLKDEYFLGGIFFDELNPAVVKCRLRDISYKLSEYIKRKIVHKTETKNLNEQSTKKHESKLFQEISDEEMDSLFKFVSQ